MGSNIVVAAISNGPYVNAIKVIPLIIILLIWARLLTWVDKDSIDARLPRVIFNMGFLVGLVVAVALFVFLPTGLIVGLAIVVVTMLIEAAAYLIARKQSVGLGDLSLQFKNWLRSLRGKAKEVKEIAGAVQLVGPNGSLLAAPETESPEAESYSGMQKMLTDPLENNADIIEIAPAEAGYIVKYSVDGVTYTGATVSKTVGAAAISYLKSAAGLDVTEVRKPQIGTLKLNISKKKRELRLTTSGSTAGEKARFISEPKKRHSLTLEGLGMLPDQLELLRASIKSKEPGIILLSAPKGQGLTSLSYAVLRAHDAFLEHILSLERDQEQDLEGITQAPLAPGATPADEAKQAAWITSQQPDVLLVSKPESPQTAQELIKAAKDGRRIYVSFVAGTTADTLSMWRKLVGDDKLAMSQLKMVISGRTLRKLCEACKQGYTPDAETLRKLNMDGGKVEQLFQARKEPIRDPKGNPIRCDFCNDLRFKGRIGIYEILVIQEDMKQVILAGGTPAQMKTAFRKQRGRYLQEIGLTLVENGDTSVQEVLRVLRSSDTPPASGGGGGGKASSSPRKPSGPGVPATA
jgi:type II secretory ATPase GspE/PulE/Tfp pilus assembly ATPase PilB-like protein